MNGRIVTLGLMTACVLTFCSVAAPSASATKGTTAFTCEKVKSGAEFSDEHCTKSGSGEGWAHKGIAVETATEVSFSNEKTAGSTTEALPTDFHFTLAGVTVTISCSIWGGLAHVLTSKPPLTPSQAVFTALALAVKSCKVTKPLKCSIKGGEANLFEGGQAKTVVKQNAAKEEEMYVEFVPAEGKPVATFTFEGSECALKGISVELKGTAKANVSTSQTQLDGPILKFVPAQTEKTLTLGGKAASLEGSLTVRMAEGGPIALTTTAS
jgi:hypothetical protein